MTRSLTGMHFTMHIFKEKIAMPSAFL